MAEQQELKIIISQDTVDFIQGLTLAGKKLDEFGKDGEFSIKSLEKALRALKKEFSGISDPLQRERLGVKIAEVAKGIQFLKDDFRQLTKAQKENTQATQEASAANTKYTNDLNNAVDGTRRARIAVYGLTQVVRDLPFGFIAISNNIPILLDQFQQLRAEQGSIGKAFSSFAQGILGAGGVTLAFSVLISTVTSLVQKYGSLSAAINGVLGLTTAFEQANRDLDNELVKVNASSAAEAIKLQSLVSILNDATSSQNTRTNAYKAVKKEYPGILQDMTVENALTATGAKLIQDRTSELIKYIALKGRENAIIKLIEKENEKVESARLEIQRSATTELNSFANVLKRAVLTGTGFRGAFAAPFTGLNKEIDGANTAIQFFSNQLDIINRELLEIDPKTSGLEDYKKLLQEQAKQQGELLKQIKAQNAEEQKTANQKIENQKRLLQQQVKSQEAVIKTTELFAKEPLALEKAYEVLFNLKKQIELLDASQITDANQRAQAILAIEQELAANLSFIYIDLRDKRIKANEDVIKEQQKQARDIEDLNTQALANVADIDNRIINKSKAFWSSLKDDVKLADNQYKAIANTLDRAVSVSIDSLFNALENGDNVFNAITQSLKRLVIELAATVIKAFALKAILSAINPTAGLFSGVAGGAGGFMQGIVNTLTGFNSAAPSGGINIQGPGGFGLSGQVVFVQRGADLVGVLNQTSARIGRIG